MRITNWQPNIEDDDVWEHIIADDLEDWAMTDWQRDVIDDDVWEQVIADDLDNWATVDNSTARLVDLCPKQIMIYEAIAEIPKDIVKKQGCSVSRTPAAGYLMVHPSIFSMRAKIAEWETSDSEEKKLE